MKHYRTFRLLAVLIMAFIIGLTGCREISTSLPSACDSIDGPSKLCDLAAEHGVNLTVIADGLGLANIIAIGKGVYTKDEALKAVTGLRQFMAAPVSYAAFRMELTETINAYPMLLNTADRYLAMLVDTKIMYKNDRELIRGWLDRLIQGLQPD